MPTYSLRRKRVLQAHQVEVIQVNADSPKEARGLALTTEGTTWINDSIEYGNITIDEAYGIRRVFTQDDQADYVGHGGTRCPACDSEDIGNPMPSKMTKETAIAICSCNACHSNWEILYQLSKFGNVKEPKHG